MKGTRSPTGAQPVRGDVVVPAAALALRSAVGLRPHDIAPGEHAGALGEPQAALVVGVDLGAWIAWALAGLPLFSREPVPTMARTVAVARRVVLGVTMERVGGNMTHAAAALGMSRRGVRERLKVAGLYEIDLRVIAGPMFSVVVPRGRFGEPEGG